jgi:FixJ family two-component response regulator
MTTTATLDGTSLRIAPDEAATPMVFVVNEDILVRESLAGLIRGSGWRAEAFGSAQAFLASPRASGPSCLILDVALPDLGGLDLQKRMVADRPEMPIIFASGYGDVLISVQAMKAGALEFLIRPFGDEVLVAAVSQALERSRRALERDAHTKVLRDRFASLTRRERDVMSLVVVGLLNKQVAGELGISEITVKAHRGQVMRKVKADSLAALVTMAARLEPETTPWAAYPPARPDLREPVLFAPLGARC